MTGAHVKFNSNCRGEFWLNWKFKTNRCIEVSFTWDKVWRCWSVMRSEQTCERHRVGGNACLSFLVRWWFVCSHLVPLVTRPSHVWASCACWGFPSGWTYWCSKGTWRAYYQRGGACGPAGCTFCWKTSHKPEWTIREIRSGILVRLI